MKFMFMTSQVSSNKGARAVRKPDILSTVIPIDIYTSVIIMLIISAVSFIFLSLFILPPKPRNGEAKDSERELGYDCSRWKHQVAICSAA